MYHHLSGLLQHRPLHLLGFRRLLHVQAPLHPPHQADAASPRGEARGRCGRGGGGGAGVAEGEAHERPPPANHHPVPAARGQRRASRRRARAAAADARRPLLCRLGARAGLPHRLPQVLIPVIFQDDLTQVATSHLQENDFVYVSGQLTGDVPPFKLTDGQATIQVLAHLLSFVDSKAAEMDIMMDEDKEEGFMKVVEAEKKVEAKKFNPKYPPDTVSEECKVP